VKRSLRLAVQLSTLLLMPVPSTCAEAVDAAELLRPLHALQDRIAQGNSDARAKASAMLGQIAEQLRGIDAQAWQKPRNVRAAVAFVLSGGDPGILQTILAAGVSSEHDKLLRGVLAYAQGRGGEAHELLVDISALSLEPLLAGHVALVQAELVANFNPVRAIALLDEARLLAPGMLVEEAALRRQISLVSAAGHPEMFEALSGQYLRRFPKSFYAGGFKQQFAAELVSRKGSAANTAKLEAALLQLEPSEQRDVFVLIATEAIARGRMDLVRFAASKALRLAQPGSTVYMRLVTYEAAALIVTGEFEQGFAALQAADRAQLETEDAELLDAALAVAEQIRRPPAASGPPGLPPPGLPPSPKLEAARQAVAQIDAMLGGARK
jgi:chemotaxis protein MotC